MKLQKHTSCIAYAFIGLLFIVSGISKIVDFQGAVDAVTGQGLPFGQFLIVLAIIFELVGGILVFFKKRVCLGVMLLITYLVVVTIVFHIGEKQLMPFLTNLAILGGLLLIKAQACNCKTCKVDDKKLKKSEGCCGGGCSS